MQGDVNERENTLQFAVGEEHLRLRAMRDDDWGSLHRWANDSEVLWYSEGDRVERRELAEVKRIYGKVCETADCFIIECDHAPIGECWLQPMNIEEIRQRHPDRRCWRIDLTIGEKPYWGRGIGTEVIRRLALRCLAADETAVVYGLVLGHNLRSRRAFERAGFRLVHEEPQPPGAKAAVEWQLARNWP